jgi:hypothetical protein
VTYVGPGTIYPNRCLSFYYDGTDFRATMEMVYSTGLSESDANGIATITLAAPTTSNLGGILAQSGATSNEWVTYVDTSGAQHLSQPGFSNLSGNPTVAQLGSGGANTYVLTDVSGTPTWQAPTSGGDTITSPNSTLNVGGTSTATTLDLAGSAGEIMAGATPALTYTPSLGKSGTAGTLSLYPASGNFTTTLGSAATASNTVDFFATVPTNLHLFYCAVSSTTCTLTDAGYAYNAIPFADLTGAAPLASPTFTGTVTYPLIATTTKCAAAGTAANPSVASCSAAPAGLFSCATNASTGTCVVDTTAVTANSVIQIQPDSSLGSALSVTCNTTADSGLTAPRVSARSAGTSFTITLGTFTTNPECFSYIIVN